MKAVQIERLGGPEVMQIVDVEIPEPQSRQVRVRVEAAGLNYSDIMLREGRYLDALQPPFLLGREFCGVVDAVGPGVSNWQPGQRVVGTVPAGAMAEYVLAPAAGLFPCPDSFSPEQGAAFLIAGITAMHIVDDCGQVSPGQRVLIHAAAGGVGTIALQIAQARGAQVVGTASSDEKCQELERLGVKAVNYAHDDWVERVREATDGAGADVILDSVGGDVFRLSFGQLLSDFGRIVIYGLASGDSVKLTSTEILESNKTVIGYYLARYFPKHADRVVEAAMKLQQLFSEGKLRLILDQTYPLSQAVEAFNRMQQRQNIGKIIIKP